MNKKETLNNFINIMIWIAVLLCIMIIVIASKCINDDTFKGPADKFFWQLVQKHEEKKKMTKISK